MSWLELVVFACGAFATPQLADTIENVSARYDVDKHLILSVVYQESRCKPNAVGAVGELGLMQVSPRWHHDRMVRLDARNLFDPESNVKVGTDLLSSLNVMSDPHTALAIYNGGYTFPESSKKYASAVIQRYQQYKALAEKDA